MRGTPLIAPLRQPGTKQRWTALWRSALFFIHSAPKQKSNEWMHLSPFYTRMHGEWLRYAKSTSQFHWRFLLVRDVRGFQVNPLCRHDITRSDRQIGNPRSLKEGTETSRRMTDELRSQFVGHPTWLGVTDWKGTMVPRGNETLCRTLWGTLSVISSSESYV